MNFNLFQADMGSFECTEIDNNKYTFMGLSSDVAKLPKGENIATGSVAVCLDTGDNYIYHRPTQQWMLQ